MNKTMKYQWVWQSAGVVLGLVLSVISAAGAVYTQTYLGNGNDSGGGVVGNGQMTLSDYGSTFSTSFTPYGRYFPECLVIYIDSQAGGFINNLTFNDTAGPQRHAISGCLDPSTRATANFARGFTADYALVLSANYGAGLYQLVSGGDYSMNLISSLSINDAGGAYTVNINWNDIGITAEAAHYLRFQSTYITATGSRYLESFETLTGARGFNTVNFDYFNTFGVEPVPEPVNVALCVFGGVAVLAGTMERVHRVRKITR